MNFRCSGGCDIPFQGNNPSNNPPMDSNEYEIIEFVIFRQKLLSFLQGGYVTRMHPSRMHTARSSNCLLGGVCLSACWDNPWVWVWRPPRSPGVGLERTPSPQVWAWRTPHARPLNFPPVWEPGDLQCML